MIPYPDKLSHPDDDFHLYNIQELLTLKDDPNRWIVPHMIPRIGRTIAYGHGGQYKSAIILDLCIAVASGGHLLEQFPVHAYGPVIFISTEGSIYTNKDRIFSHIRSRGIHPETVKLYFSRNSIRLDRPQGLATLEKKIARIHPLILVLDPFVSFFEGNENSSEAVTAFTKGVNEIIEKFNLSCIIIHHANKEGDLRGSTALWDWADSVLEFTTQRKVTLPGMRNTVSILSVEGKKQRDGDQGKLFSVAPVINSELGMIDFGVHADISPAGVIITYLKQAVYRFLLTTKAPPTKSELAAFFYTGHDKMEAALGWLIRDGLVEEVSTQEEKEIIFISKKRGRSTIRYRVVPGASKLDAARAMIEIEKRSSINTELQPDGYYNREYGKLRAV